MGFHCQFCQSMPGNSLNTVSADTRNYQAAFSPFQPAISRRRMRECSARIIFIRMEPENNHFCRYGRERKRDTWRNKNTRWT